MTEQEPYPLLGVSEDPEPGIEYHWSMKCNACGTGSSGAADTHLQAAAAMRLFSERTCESFHFDLAEEGR